MTTLNVTKETAMRSIVLLALIAGFLAGCATSPQSQEEDAAAINADRQVWPPYDPNSAFPAQTMDGDGRSRRSSRDGGGRDGGGRDGGGRDGGGRDGGGRDGDGRGGGRR